MHGGVKCDVTERDRMRNESGRSRSKITDVGNDIRSQENCLVSLAKVSGVTLEIKWITSDINYDVS